METTPQYLYKQTDGDWGDPFKSGGSWEEFRLENGSLIPTGGYLRMSGSDAGGPENMCYTESKHISPSGNKKVWRKFKSEDWCNNWIRNNDVDCVK